MKNKINVFYVWGYGSSPDSNSISFLKKALSNKDYHIMSDYYAQYNPEEALIDIKNYIKELKIDVLVGSSLGGYLTLQIPNIKKVIINPCLHPETELALLTTEIEKKDDEGNNILDENGKPVMETVPAVPEHIIKFYSDYISRNDVWSKYDEREDAQTVWVIGNSDEVLGDKFVNEIKEHTNNIVISEQGHNNTLQSITKYVAPEIKKMCETK